MSQRLIVTMMLAAALTLGACRTPTRGGLQGAAASVDMAPASLSPKERVWRIVPRLGIERFVPPASGANGIHDSVAGLWFTKGLYRGPVVMTLAHATWDKQTQTAEFIVRGHRNYAFRNDATNVATRRVVADKEEVKDPYVTGYRLRFTDTTYGDVLPTYADQQSGVRYVEEPTPQDRYTMTLKQDGWWERRSVEDGKPLPNYDLIRIVRADGTREKAYESEYLRLAPEQLIVPVDKDSLLATQVLGDVEPPAPAGPEGQTDPEGSGAILNSNQGREKML